MWVAKLLDISQGEKDIFQCRLYAVHTSMYSHMCVKKGAVLGKKEAVSSVFSLIFLNRR